MSKVYLNDIVSFCNNTYESNYGKNNTKIQNFTDKINIVIQNEKLNNSKFKCNFVDILSLTNYYDSNELILVSPIIHENDKEGKKWYNFINSLLIVLNDSYVNDSNDKKIKSIETLNNLLKKKINIYPIVEKNNNDNFEKVASVLNICVAILEINTFKFYNLNDKNKKYVIIFRHDDYYFPFINWDNKYYNEKSHFVNELIKKYDIIKKSTDIDDIVNNNIITENTKDTEDTKDNKDKNTKKTKKNKSEDIIIDEKKTKKEIKTKNKIEKDIKSKIKISENIIKSDKENENNGKYKEFISNEKNIIFMSEAVALTNNKKNNKIEKNIIEDSMIDETEIEKTTVKLKTDDKKKIIGNVKKSMNIQTLRDNALEIGLEIVYKDTKTGKLKNKTKDVLYEEIKKFKLV